MATLLDAGDALSSVAVMSVRHERIVKSCRSGIFHRNRAVQALPGADKLHADGFGDVERGVGQHIERRMKIADAQLARERRRGQCAQLSATSEQ